MSTIRSGVLPVLCSAMVLVSLVLAAPTSPNSVDPQRANQTTNVEADLTIEPASKNNASDSFTCHNRPMGFYADVQHACKVYHFCLQGDLDGELVSQRVSYYCLNQTQFDQQKLDCVAPANVSTVCEHSAKYFEESNLVMMEAFQGRNLDD